MQERERLLKMTLSTIPVAQDIDYQEFALKMDGYSSANVVQTAQRAAKISVLEGSKKVSAIHFEQAIAESSKF